MKVTFISDVHGNLGALGAVLAAVDDGGPVVFCGDAVGYGDDPDGVCSLLSERGIASVKGNHDAMVLEELPCHPDRDALYRTSWTRKRLSDSNLNWLSSLPHELSLMLDGTAFRVRHASPWDLTTYLYPDSPRLKEAMPTNHENLILGHTHYPFVRSGTTGDLVNCGSVGQPRGGAPGAQFTVFDTGSQTWVQRTLLYE